MVEKGVLQHDPQLFDQTPQSNLETSSVNSQEVVMEKKDLDQIKDLQRSIISQTSNSLLRINSLTEGLDCSPNGVKVVDVSAIEEEGSMNTTPRNPQ